MVVIGIGLGVAIAVQTAGHDTDTISPAELLAKLGIVLALCGVFYLLTLWSALAVAVKRLHDRNKGAWWLLVFYVLPIILSTPRNIAIWHAVQDGTFIALAQQGRTMEIGGPIAIVAGGAASLIGLWAFVELYCLRGTVGDNRYGPDPLAGKV
ncbi:MAG: DUF805 domain-containing protein [Rhizomicrobium sp.]